MREDGATRNPNPVSLSDSRSVHDKKISGTVTRSASSMQIVSEAEFGI